MANTILGHLNLLKLRGSKSITYDGEEGVFIPYNRNGAGIVRGEEDGKTRARLRIAIVAYADKFGHDFMAIRAKTAWEFKHKKATEIFGNFKFTKGSYFKLEPNEDYAPDIVNFISGTSNEEEKEVDL